MRTRPAVRVVEEDRRFKRPRRRNGTLLDAYGSLSRPVSGLTPGMVAPRRRVRSPQGQERDPIFHREVLSCYRSATTSRPTTPNQERLTSLQILVRTRVGSSCSAGRRKATRGAHAMSFTAFTRAHSVPTRRVVAGREGHRLSEKSEFWALDVPGQPVTWYSIPPPPSSNRWISTGFGMRFDLRLEGAGLRRGWLEQVGFMFRKRTRQAGRDLRGVT